MLADTKSFEERSMAVATLCETVHYLHHTAYPVLEVFPRFSFILELSLFSLRFTSLRLIHSLVFFGYFAFSPSFLLFCEGWLMIATMASATTVCLLEG